MSTITHRHGLTPLHNMDRKYFRSAVRIAALCILVLIPRYCYSSPDTTWGQETNGLRFGIRLSTQSGIFGTPPLCGLDLVNVSTNLIYIQLPVIAHRYKIQCFGPDGHEIPLKPNARISDVSTIRRVSYDPGASSEIDIFSIPDGFMLHTNGLHTLVASVWVSTNFLWRSPSKSFLLPPVTNIVDIQVFHPKEGIPSITWPDSHLMDMFHQVTNNPGGFVP